MTMTYGNEEWEENEKILCPRCEGEGIWYKHGRMTYTEDEYNELPQEEQLKCKMVICPKCKGEGYING